MEVHKDDSPEERDWRKFHLGINFGPCLKCPLEEKEEESDEEKEELDERDMPLEGSDTWQGESPLDAERGFPDVSQMVEEPRREGLCGGRERETVAKEATVKMAVAQKVTAQKIEVMRRESGDEDEEFVR